MNRITQQPTRPAAMLPVRALNDIEYLVKESEVLTGQAGRCFVTFAQQDGHTYGLVILGSNSQNIFREAAELFDWAFTSPELHPAPAEPEVEPEKHGLSAFWHKVFG